MKHFLHWSCALVLGLMCSAVHSAYGFTGAVLAIVGSIYVMIAQWCEGRYFE